MNAHFPAIVLCMLLFLFSVPDARSQQYADRSANDTANYPYWYEMIQNPDVNFFKTQDAFNSTFRL